LTDPDFSQKIQQTICTELDQRNQEDAEGTELQQLNVWQ
jgi:hypothetical protein